MPDWLIEEFEREFRGFDKWIDRYFKTKLTF